MAAQVGGMAAQVGRMAAQVGGMAAQVGGKAGQVGRMAEMSSQLVMFMIQCFQECFPQLWLLSTSGWFFDCLFTSMDARKSSYV